MQTNSLINQATNTGQNLNQLDSNFQSSKNPRVNPFPIARIRFNYISPQNSPRILPAIQFNQAGNAPLLVRKQIKFVKIIELQETYSGTPQNPLALQARTQQIKRIQQEKIQDIATVKKSNLPPIFEHPNDQDEELITFEKIENKEIYPQLHKQTNHHRYNSGQSAQKSNQSLTIQDDKTSLKYKLQQVIGKNQEQKNSLKASQDLQNLQQKAFKKQKVNRSSSIPVTLEESIYKKLFSFQKPEFINLAQLSQENNITQENNIDKNEASPLALESRKDTLQSFQLKHETDKQKSKQQYLQQQHENEKRTNQASSKKPQQILAHTFLVKAYKIKVKKKDLSDLYWNEDQKNE